MSYQAIEQCRVCGNTQLVDVLDLGMQALTGYFPSSQRETVDKAPLQLVKCHGEDSCQLLQLKHTYQLEKMYGKDYGYRSGLNPSMVRHLQQAVDSICQTVSLQADDIVLDIGSNDGTTLNHFSSNCDRIGIDPTAIKYDWLYQDNIKIVADFFSAEHFQAIYGMRKAKVITSFSMFYDLPAPLDFVKQIASILADDGIWVFENSYLPLMLQRNSFDTVCHEHLEYYSLSVIKWILQAAGMKILSISFNDVNGGSIRVIAGKNTAELAVDDAAIEQALAQEQLLQLDTLIPYQAFAKRVEQIKQSLLAFLHQAKDKQQSVAALGASTKGNVILQYCGIDKRLIREIGEVNIEKFGAYTPGSLIPIVNELAVLAEQYDWLLVLPWHFKSHFTAGEAYRKQSLVFPLPDMTIVEAKHESHAE